MIDDYEHDRRLRAEDKRAVHRCANKIERAIADLVATRLCGDVGEFSVADEIFEQLLVALLDRNPKSMDWLNRHSGPATMRIAVALADWRDKWAER